jgi:HlyD family secretion protein
MVVVVAGLLTAPRVGSLATVLRLPLWVNLRLAPHLSRYNNNNVKTFDEKKFDDKTKSADPARSASGGPSPPQPLSQSPLGQAAATQTSLGQRVQSLRLPDHARGRSSSKLAWFLCLVFALSTAWLAFQRYGRPTGDSQETTEGAGSPKRPTTIARQSEVESEIAHESKGYIIPTHQILVSPKVSGVVTELNIEEGQRVAEGTILARIEDTDYKTDHDRAQATLTLAQERLGELESGNRPEEVSQARAELEEAVVTVGQYAADLQRAVDLHRRRVISDGEFQELQSKHEAQERRVEKLKFALALMTEGPREEKIRAARAEVSQAQADVVKTRWRLDNCIVRAPISGTILSKDAEEGNLVNPIAFSGSRSLCEMADLSSLEVDLSIVERDISKVFKGQKCVVKAEAYPDREYHGVVSRLMPIADRAKGAVSVRVLLSVPANEEGIYLKPEMSARVTFLKNEAATSAPPASTAAATDAAK